MSDVRSAELFATAQQLLPGGVDSPVRAFRAVGGTPRFIARGKGSVIWDVDGNRYVDYLGSWGPLIVGHAHPGEVAAVIVEPVAGNMGVVPPAPGFLGELRQLTRQHGSVLIFDEVITGFRVALGGAQQRYGVVPDLTCLGKILGGGLPVGAYGGSRAIMELVSPLGPVYQAGTLSGNPLPLAAGIATLRLLSEPGVYQRLEEL